MDKITIEIRTTNAAFRADDEGGDHGPFTALAIAEITGRLCNRLRKGERPVVLVDSNGNSVGTVRYEGNE